MRKDKCDRCGKKFDDLYNGRSMVIPNEISYSEYFDCKLCKECFDMWNNKLHRTIENFLKN